MNQDQPAYGFLLYIYIPMLTFSRLGMEQKPFRDWQSHCMAGRPLADESKGDWIKRLQGARRTENTTTLHKLCLSQITSWSLLQEVDAEVISLEIGTSYKCIGSEISVIAVLRRVGQRDAARVSIEDIAAKLKNLNVHLLALEIAGDPRDVFNGDWTTLPVTGHEYSTEDAWAYDPPYKD